MKAKVIALLLVVCFLLGGCGINEVKSTASKDEASMFVAVEYTDVWTVVYHKETLVMYAVSSGHYNYGTFTLLVDENGDPMIWEG